MSLSFANVDRGAGRNIGIGNGTWRSIASTGAPTERTITGGTLRLGRLSGKKSFITITTFARDGGRQKRLKTGATVGPSAEAIGETTA